eukprot:1716352-Lingulodinium_polyedra.AAC.1
MAVRTLFDCCWETWAARGQLENCLRTTFKLLWIRAMPEISGNPMKMFDCLEMPRARVRKTHRAP